MANQLIRTGSGSFDGQTRASADNDQSRRQMDRGRNQRRTLEVGKECERIRNGAVAPRLPWRFGKPSICWREFQPRIWLSNASHWQVGLHSCGLEFQRGSNCLNA